MDRRKFLTITAGAAAALLVSSQEKPICYHHETKDEKDIKSSKAETPAERKKRIEREYQKMKNFYLENASEEKKELFKDSEKQDEYLEEIEKKYLLSDYSDSGDNISKKEELIKRWKFSIEIQEKLKNKLRQVGESDEYLKTFVDGKIGDKTIFLASNILDFKISLKDIFCCYTKERKEKFLSMLEEGRLIIPETKKFFSYYKKEIMAIEKIWPKIRQFVPTAEDRSKKDGRTISEKIERGLNIISKEKRKLLESPLPNEGKLKMGTILMLAAVNFMIDSWDGSPARPANGWAHYPFESSDPGNYYSRIDCATYIKRIFEKLFPTINSWKKEIAQPMAKEQAELYAQFLGVETTYINQNEKSDSAETMNDLIAIEAVKMFGYDKPANHMRFSYIAFPEEESGFKNYLNFIPKISEASSTGKVIKRIDFGDRLSRFRTNISDPKAVEKWLKE